MKRAFESWMYGLTMRGDWFGNIIARVWFHWYCPHPLHKEWTARQCVARGECGCDNGPRLSKQR